MPTIRLQLQHTRVVESRFAFRVLYYNAVRPQQRDTAQNLIEQAFHEVLT